ncbi:MAG: GNAT family N-acetyltransferase [Bacteroidetes bacterium]|nr:GNAT family N-acetyltransferase [Bacteroidota bacterium]
MIINYLQTDSYWAQERTEMAIIKSIENSLCFGVYLPGRQIGFGRAVTDMATVFYLADIFVLPEYQNQGIGKILTDHMLNHPQLKGLRGILTTQTAHSFYSKFGFSRDNDIAQRRIMILQNNRCAKDH